MEKAATMEVAEASVAAAMVLKYVVAMMMAVATATAMVR